MASSAAQQEFDDLVRDQHRADAQHPEDRARDSDVSDADDPRDEADYYEKLDTDDEVPDRGRAMRSSYYLPSLRGDANTGPKGVIADAHAFEAARKQAASNANAKAGSSRLSAWRKESPQRGYVKQDEDELLSDADSDSSFMAKWREARMKEMRGRKSGSNSRTASPRRAGRRWGALEAVDGEGYLEAVEGGKLGEVVVVFIYDDLSDISTILEHFVRKLAAKHDHVRFVKLHYEEAEMEIAGVPAVLAYRNADKFAGLVPLVDELPEDADLNVSTLERVFERYQIL